MLQTWVLTDFNYSVFLWLLFWHLVVGLKWVWWSKDEDLMASPKNQIRAECANIIFCERVKIILNVTSMMILKLVLILFSFHFGFHHHLSLNMYENQKKKNPQTHLFFFDETKTSKLISYRCKIIVHDLNWMTDIGFCCATFYRLFILTSFARKITGATLFIWFALYKCKLYATYNKIIEWKWLEIS